MSDCKESHKRKAETEAANEPKRQSRLTGKFLKKIVMEEVPENEKAYFIETETSCFVLKASTLAKESKQWEEWFKLPDASDTTRITKTETYIDDEIYALLMIVVGNEPILFEPMNAYSIGVCLDFASHWGFESAKDKIAECAIQTVKKRTAVDVFWLINALTEAKLHERAKQVITSRCLGYHTRAGMTGDWVYLLRAWMKDDAVVKQLAQWNGHQRALFVVDYHQFFPPISSD